MMSKLREKYLSNLEESASSIMKKLAAGQSITSNEYLFLRMFQKELRASEQVPITDSFLKNANKIVNFVKNNLSGLLSSVTEE